MSGKIFVFSEKLLCLRKMFGHVRENFLRSPAPPLANNFWDKNIN
jgi:hypothetical protein